MRTAGTFEEVVEHVLLGVTVRLQTSAALKLEGTRAGLVSVRDSGGASCREAPPLVSSTPLRRTA
jgi:hypothetical protein